MSQRTHFYEAPRREKARIPILDYGWYPYDSLALRPEIAGLLKEAFLEVWDLAWKHGALDHGRGDGYFGALLASQRVSTDAASLPEVFPCIASRRPPEALTKRFFGDSERPMAFRRNPVPGIWNL